MHNEAASRDASRTLPADNLLKSKLQLSSRLDEPFIEWRPWILSALGLMGPYLPATQRTGAYEILQDFPRESRIPFPPFELQPRVKVDVKREFPRAEHRVIWTRNVTKDEEEDAGIRHRRTITSPILKTWLATKKREREKKGRRRRRKVMVYDFLGWLVCQIYCECCRRQWVGRILTCKWSHAVSLIWYDGFILVHIIPKILKVMAIMHVSRGLWLTFLYFMWRKGALHVIFIPERWKNS